MEAAAAAAALQRESALRSSMICKCNTPFKTSRSVNSTTRHPAAAMAANSQGRNDVSAARDVSFPSAGDSTSHLVVASVASTSFDPVVVSGRFAPLGGVPNAVVGGPPIVSSRSDTTVTGGSLVVRTPLLLSRLSQPAPVVDLTSPPVPIDIPVSESVSEDRGFYHNAPIMTTYRPEPNNGKHARLESDESSPSSGDVSSASGLVSPRFHPYSRPPSSSTDPPTSPGSNVGQTSMSI